MPVMARIADIAKMHQLDVPLRKSLTGQRGPLRPDNRIRPRQLVFGVRTSLKASCSQNAALGGRIEDVQGLREPLVGSPLRSLHQLDKAEPLSPRPVEFSADRRHLNSLKGWKREDYWLMGDPMTNKMIKSRPRIIRNSVTIVSGASSSCPWK